MNKNIRDMFSSLPATYELINHILTLGFDTPLRRYAAKIAVIGNKKKYWLDACTGTGEMAHHLSKYANQNTTIIAADFSFPMLRYAVKRRSNHLNFVLANSINLPFKDNTFDIITISFAIRNINVSRQNMLGCLGEFHRVLRPGGTFIGLETSQPSATISRKMVNLFIKIFVKPIGSIISGSDSAYGYLSQTIPRFYNAAELSKIILEAGFKTCNYRLLFGGIAAIHRGIK
jgi:demethylmenaquinone methyltransferase / 2-methoxy-6-polyprenyl-1,4-benzoquinol methylase